MIRCHCYSYKRSGIFFFFFKQKTAYEMRISDWSSDLCSSDLLKLAYEAEILKPQARAGPREGGPEPLAASSPCETNVLAGEATCDYVDGDAVCIHNFLGQA